jgi:hypothetical protein
MQVYRVRTAFTGAGIVGPAVSTAYFDAAAGSAANAVTAWALLWANLSGSMSTALSFSTGGVVDSLDVATGNLMSTTFVAPTVAAGAATGDQAPIATQARIDWATGTIAFGRRLVGRTFVPAITESDGAGGPGASLVAAVAVASAAVIAAANSDLVIWSRTHNYAQPAISGTCWSKYAVLRSRRD